MCDKKVNQFVGGDLLLSDNEASFKTDWVQALEIDNGITYFNLLILLLISSVGLFRRYYPAQLGHLLDPCDNEFHASVKRRYCRIIGDHQRPSLLTRIKAIYQAYKNEPEESIRDYFASYENYFQLT